MFVSLQLSRIGPKNVNSAAALRCAMEQLRDEVFVAHIFLHRNGLSTPEKPASFLEISPDESQITREESDFRF
ncbi:hypothetical protein Tco_1133954 [Tanacetum coccineum]